MKTLRFIPPCVALLNQGVYIGDDPVGHRCLRDAVQTVEVGGREFPLCDSCRAIVLWDIWPDDFLLWSLSLYFGLERFTWTRQSP